MKMDKERLEPQAKGKTFPPAKRRKWRRLWAPPDPDLVDAGVRGELLIAGIRLLIVLLLLYLPLADYLRSPYEDGRRLVLWLAVAALAEALVVYSAVSRSWGRGWIGFFSGILDVSLISLTLWVFLRLGSPLGATHDLLIFPLYLLAIGATSLRYDWRICVLTGAAAVAQYAGLVLYTAWLWDLTHPGSELAAHFSWIQQGGRLLLLATATLLAAAVVSRAREQRHLSTRDRLTNLANRGFFDESLPRLGAIASRSGDPVTVAMIDIDHFKRFNDTHGHLAGDEALKDVASTLAGSFRSTDLIARYGGEEFAAVFPGMGASDARWRLEQMRAKIESLTIALGDSRPPAQVTVSMGVAVWPHDGDDLLETLAIADRWLYRAKAAGRNCVAFSETKEGK